MSRVPLYLKNITCLESLWNDALENRLRVLPILELTSQANTANFVRLTCNTRAELRYNLSKRKSCGILMPAF